MGLGRSRVQGSVQHMPAACTPALKPGILGRDLGALLCFVLSAVKYPLVGFKHLRIMYS